MPAAPSAQEVPFLPKHVSHGSQLSNQSTAGIAGISGNPHLTGRRRNPDPHSLTTWYLWLNAGWWNGITVRDNTSTNHAALGPISGFYFSNSINECRLSLTWHCSKNQSFIIVRDYVTLWCGLNFCILVLICLAVCHIFPLHFGSIHARRRLKKLVII